MRVTWGSSGLRSDCDDALLMTGLDRAGGAMGVGAWLQMPWTHGFSMDHMRIMTESR